jgi:hypothetical protein
VYDYALQAFAAVAFAAANAAPPPAVVAHAALDAEIEPAPSAAVEVAEDDDPFTQTIVGGVVVQSGVRVTKVVTPRQLPRLLSRTGGMMLVYVPCVEAAMYGENKEDVMATVRDVAKDSTFVIMRE